MKQAWQTPEAAEIAIFDGRGAEIPVNVRSYVKGAIEPLKRLAKLRGVHLVHDGSWPPVAVIGWQTLNQIVEIGNKVSAPDPSS